MKRRDSPGETATSETILNFSKFCLNLNMTLGETGDNQKTGAVKMYLKGPILIAASAACLGVVALANQHGQVQNLSASLSRTIDAASSECMDNSIETGFGSLRCVQTTSGLFD